MVRAATSLRSFDGHVKSSTTSVSRIAGVLDDDVLDEVEDTEEEEEEADEMLEAEDLREEVEDTETVVELDD